MLERYQGKEGRPALMDALRRQFLIDGSSDIAEMVASSAQLREYAKGEAVFNQGDRGGELCFIIVGKVSVQVDQRPVATVEPGFHVGEIGMLEPFKGRSATVLAIEPVVAVHITQPKFFDIAKLHPELLVRLALELGHRLVDTQRRG